MLAQGFDGMLGNGAHVILVACSAVILVPHSSLSCVVLCGYRLQVQTSSFLKRSLFNWGLSRKTYFMKQGRPQAQVGQHGSAAVLTLGVLA